MYVVGYYYTDEEMKQCFKTVGYHENKTDAQKNAFAYALSRLCDTYILEPTIKISLNNDNVFKCSTIEKKKTSKK